MPNTNTAVATPAVNAPSNSDASYDKLTAAKALAACTTLTEVIAAVRKHASISQDDADARCAAIIAASTPAPKM